jgi:hypothetical protein
MGWLKKLLSTPPPPDRRPVPDREAAIRELLESVERPPAAPADVFDFKENLAATTGEVTEYRPMPQTMYLEVITSGNRVIAADTVGLSISEIAPRGPHTLGSDNEVKCTYVVIGDTNRAHQEFVAPLGRIIGMPVHIPDHLLKKDTVGGTAIRIWWSCEQREER